MKKFTIWLSDAPQFWDFMEGNPNLQRTMKGTVDAEDLNEAYRESQRGISQWKHRSCSVSDVIEEDGKFFLAEAIGFKEIPEPFPGYKK